MAPHGVAPLPDCQHAQGQHRAREDAFNQMLSHAGKLGANAVIGVRYDATEIGNGITEVLCYGTAVSVERVG